MLPTPSVSQYVGIVLTLFAVVAIGVLSMRGIHGSRDFRGDSHRSSSAVVMGAIVGTIIGGSSTIGTAQLAYVYGLSACWFTAGSSVACLLFGLVYSRRLYQNSESTASGIIRREYGPAAGLLASIINAGGMFIALIAQMISAVAVWSIVFPAMTRVQALFLTVLLVMAYVVFGGVRGVGMIGVFKLVLLYLAVFGGGCLALWKFGGIHAIVSTPLFADNHFFDPFARGWSTDLGSALSAALGCLGSQSYIQAIRSGSSVASARRGAVLSAFIIPPIGLGATLIGLYMRVNYPLLPEAKLALPYFLAANTPALVCGIVLGAILITVVGASAGIALGISSIVSNDFIHIQSDRKDLLFSRTYIVLLLIAAAILSFGNMGNMILDYSFLGLGVRAVSCVIAYTVALFWPGKCSSPVMISTMLLGPIVILLCEVFGCPVDSLMVSYLVSVPFLAIALCLQKARSHLLRNSKL